MRRSFPMFALLAFIATQTIACSSPWKVLRQSNPNPFHKNTPFAADSSAFRAVRVGQLPEDTYKQNLNKAEKDRWESDKTFFSRDFQNSVRQSSTGIQMSARVLPKSYIVKPYVQEIHPSNGSTPLKVKLNVRIEKKDSIFDEIEMVVEVKPNEGPNFSHRFRKAAQIAGERAAKYLKDRAK